MILMCSLKYKYLRLKPIHPEEHAIFMTGDRNNDTLADPKRLKTGRYEKCILQ
jgi:hypothetical protein